MHQRACQSTPAYRGAAPIHWAVMNGEQETGVMTMQMDAGLDTGDILLSARTPVGPNETAGDLWDRLSGMGATLLIDTLDQLDSLTLNRKTMRWPLTHRSWTSLWAALTGMETPSKFTIAFGERSHGPVRIRSSAVNHLRSNKPVWWMEQVGLDK